MNIRVIIAGFFGETLILPKVPRDSERGDGKFSNFLSPYRVRERPTVYGSLPDYCAVVNFPVFSGTYSGI